MSSKDIDNSSYLAAEDSKDAGSKLILSKFEYDLFHDEDNVINKVIRVKRFGSPTKGETWKIYEDSRIANIIDGKKLTKKEKMFLYTPEGIGFIVRQHKEGVTALSAFKKNMKQYLK
jgi:hypothetical protein